MKGGGGESESMISKTGIFIYRLGSGHVFYSLFIFNKKLRERINRKEKDSKGYL